MNVMWAQMEWRKLCLCVRFCGDGLSASRADQSCVQTFRLVCVCVCLCFAFDFPLKWSVLLLARMERDGIKCADLMFSSFTNWWKNTRSSNESAEWQSEMRTGRRQKIRQKSHNNCHLHRNFVTNGFVWYRKIGLGMAFVVALATLAAENCW